MCVCVCVRVCVCVYVFACVGTCCIHFCSSIKLQVVLKPLMKNITMENREGRMHSRNKMPKTTRKNDLKVQEIVKEPGVVSELASARHYATE